VVQRRTICKTLYENYLAEINGKIL